MRYEKIEVISPYNITRWKQIAEWILEENPENIEQVRKLILSIGIKKGYDYFYNYIEIIVNSSIFIYTIEKSSRKYGKKNIINVLFRLLFGNIRELKKRYKKKETIEEKTEQEIKRTYKKEIKIGNIESYIEFVNIKEKPQQRIRDKKTGRFIKIPKKYKVNGKGIEEI